MSSVVQAFTGGGGPSGTPTMALTSAGSSVSATMPCTGPNAQIWNSSATNVAWVIFGNAGVAAVAAIPGTPSASIPIPPNAALVISIPATATVMAMISVGATVFASIGEGI